MPYQDRVKVKVESVESQEDESNMTRESALSSEPEPAYVSSDEKIKQFFMPKLIISCLILITLHFFMYTHSMRLVTYI